MSTDFAPEMHERSTGFGTKFKEFIASIGFKWTQDQVGTDCGLSRRTVRVEAELRQMQKPQA